VLVARDDVRASIQHSLGKTSRVQALGLEVLNHGPGSPAAHETGVERVNAGANQCNATTVAKGSGGDILGSETKGGSYGFAGGSEGVGQVFGRDNVGFVTNVVRIQGSGRRCCMLAKVKHLLQDCLHRRCTGMGCVAMGYWLVFITILLFGKVQGNCCGSGQQGQRSCGTIQRTTWGLEGGVLESARMGILGATGAVDVLARAKDEEETNCDS